MKTFVTASFLFDYMSYFGQTVIVEDFYSRVTNDLFHDQSEMKNFAFNMNKMFNEIEKHAAVQNFNTDCNIIQNQVKKAFQQINKQVQNMTNALSILNLQYNQINIMLSNDQRLQEWMKRKHTGKDDYFK